MKDWQLTTPEANEVITAYIEWENEHYCDMRCFCHCCNIQKVLIKSK